MTELVWVDGGEFRMGCDVRYREEAPVHRVVVDGFWMRPTVVTNGEFLFVPAQKIVGDFLETFQEFPPRQKAASFSLDQVLEKLQSGIGSK